MRRGISATFVLLALFLGGCPTPSGPDPVRVDFQGRAPIALDVAGIGVEQRYAPPGQAPYIDHELAQPPSEAVRAWAEQRLRAAGNAGQARVLIQEASLIEERLARTAGIQGMVAIDQSERYTLRLAARIEAENPARGSGYVEASAERSVTVPENATLSEREATWTRLIEATIGDLDTAIEERLRQHLPNLIRG